MTQTTKLDTQAIMTVLAHVPDPEIPVVNIVDLGIVRGIVADPPRVLVSPTYTGCPATIAIEQSIRLALDAAGYEDVGIERQLFPPWTTEWISDAGRKALLDYGIAPPSEARTATCPRCSSLNTEEVSRFGATPCKAQWRCRDCLEPFDRFKCH